MTSLREWIEEQGGIDKVLEAVSQRNQMAAHAPKHQTFEELCGIEPRLRVLFKGISEVMARRDGFWKNWSHVKMQMCKLVGSDSGNPLLSSSADYDIAYRALYDEAERVAPED